MYKYDTNAFICTYRGPTIFFGHFEKSTSRWSLVPKTFEIVST